MSSIPSPNFRKMKDDELEQFINTYPSRFDLQSAIFEHSRRVSERSNKTDESRHKEILWWTIVAAIAALVAAASGVWMLFR